MKTKWFTANFPAGLDGLYQSIINTPFDSDKGWGFSINSYEENAISSRYIEKVEINEIIVDPYGNETQYTQLKYIQFNFWLYTTKGKNFILIIESPPRSIKNFISNIIKSTHSDFNVSNLNIKIEDFIYFLTPHFEKIQVHKAKLKDLTFSKHTSGILELESSSDALMEIRNIFKNANFTIDKVKLNVKDVTGYESLEINTNGSISLSEQIFDKVYLTIERFAL
ncbi:hypothetical protein LXC10_004155 [Salmonella enterica subsp. enterica serovar Muenster]|uniref:Uncharacterized protein n=5 Tax=Enterobacteriaceae TaxID=543 RepID=A0A5J1PVV0_SALMS|nr:hypothetical protein [Salmonella enterica]EAA9881553.1 hypothetical protein [Salmonella enterica subsp. enterica serovar Anatum]EAA9885214.1 hypothetical protein [Salmonella enterica subsp. enterica]EAB6932038.1 hypothetical protein [Salmonella enterica subsp. enterica serovar Muenster]EBD5045070.1 hypothetical protein [Salmonella enterica subsp. enterica serovar Lille]EBL4157207.1 hypothetical protein [Salmonella enterica subsp. enterica serovar Infantis]EBW8626953.1 hypothetical protein 